jgi:hypothetical protein
MNDLVPEAQPLAPDREATTDSRSGSAADIMAAGIAPRLRPVAAETDD